MPDVSKTSENWAPDAGCASSDVFASFCFASLKAFSSLCPVKSAHFSFFCDVTGWKEETGDPHSVG